MGKIQVACCICGTKILKLPSEVKRYKPTCSKKCLSTIQHLPKNIGNKNGMWKGDKVGYEAVHAWVKRHLTKSELCQSCGLKPSFDLANISQKYRRDLNDWEWLCRRCHMIKDGRMKQFNQFADISGV